MQSRHMEWANGTDDLEARQKHLDIADKLKETCEQYCSLLEVYDKATQ